jgi:hypothetical protein
MWKTSRAKGITLLELFLDLILLLLFSALAFVAGCLLTYGYIPIPSEWANRTLVEKNAAGYHIQADSFRLKLNGEIQLAGIQVHTENIRLPILEADNAVVQYQLWQRGAFHFKATGLVVSNGTLHLPAVYAPDGMRTPILERMAFHLVPSVNLIRVESFAAIHEDIRLRGTIEWPLDTLGFQSQSAETVDSIGRLYQFIAAALKEKKRFPPLIQPTLAFDLRAPDDDSVQISARLSCHELKHAEATGKDFSLDAAIQLKDGILTSKSPLLLAAKELDLPRFEVSAQSLVGHIAEDEWTGLLSGIWPEFEITAHRLSIHEIDLETPKVTVSPKSFPELHFTGSTNGLKGAVAFSGMLNTANQSGRIHANGSVDLASLIPQTTLEKLPTLYFESPPHYNLSVRLNEGFVIDSAEFKINNHNLRANGITFDHVLAEGSFSNGIFELKDVIAVRGKQWLEAKFSLDGNSHDYKVTLIGSAVPYEYNALLPKWWAAIFKDFRFTSDSSGLGDFIIYGNTQARAADLYWGHAAVSNISYKEVPLDRGELIVRGRGRYVELHQLDATSGEGWVRGNIAFTSRKDAIKAPVSIRYDFDSHMPLDAARKIFGGNVAKIINDFEVTDLPHVTLRGVNFNKAYPQYKGLSSFYLKADAQSPIRFKRVPLDNLRFTLNSRQTITHLRDIAFGYAGGTGTSMIDILTPETGSNELRFKLSLNGANQTQAIQNIPTLEKVEDHLENTSPEDVNQKESLEEKLSLNLHTRGAVDSLYRHHGYGDFTITNKKLGSIQLLGPLSKLLQNTRLNFTSFNLDRMVAEFEIAGNELLISKLQIDGPQTQIKAKGTVQIKDQALNMRVRVNLFANLGTPDSPLRKVSDVLTSPIKSLLEFDLTGTIHEQKLRSLFDPRNLIPGL